jgi:hypothetical protein
LTGVKKDPVYTYLKGFHGRKLKAKADLGWDELFPSLEDLI